MEEEETTEEVPIPVEPEIEPISGDLIPIPLPPTEPEVI